MFGPKRTSLCACVPLCLSWLLMAVAPNMTSIYSSRILVGLGNGILTSSVYIVEVVPAKNRGSIVMVNHHYSQISNNLSSISISVPRSRRRSVVSV